MQEDKLATMKELVDKLNKASDTYYNGRAEMMFGPRMGRSFRPTENVWRKKRALSYPTHQQPT